MFLKLFNLCQIGFTNFEGGRRKDTRTEGRRERGEIGREWVKINAIRKKFSDFFCFAKEIFLWRSTIENSSLGSNSETIAEKYQHRTLKFQITTESYSYNYYSLVVPNLSTLLLSPVHLCMFIIYLNYLF